jgi:hypothetical protein
MFAERFQPFAASFVMIGGTACDMHFSSEGLTFRTTRDLDIVLLLETIDRRFVVALREFIDHGRYEIRERTYRRPILHRFARPADERYPAMLELFSRAAGHIELAEGQRIISIEHEPGHQSLSAILLDDTYYHLICGAQVSQHGLRFATIETLIALKARAWIDLTTRLGRGERVDTNDINKHRNDVFRLAAIMPGTRGPTLADSIAADMNRFMAAFPESSSEWPAILAALKTSISGGLRAASLRAAILSTFDLPEA